jgi:hypothetical protein
LDGGLLGNHMLTANHSNGMEGNGFSVHVP